MKNQTKTVLAITTRHIKVLSLATLMLFSSTSTILAQDVENSEDNPFINYDQRVEVEYKQRHSKVSRASENLLADGIKIKRDLTILKEIQEQRMLAEDEIPSDDLYGGIWVSNKVNAYDILKNSSDTMEIDLTGFFYPAPDATKVTSNFGIRGRRFHYGIDLKVLTGDTIYAAFDGKVRMKQYERKGYGNYVVLRHINGLETIYGHLSKWLVDVDDVVRAGDPIGLGGNTGRSTGSHLHFEIRYLGKAMDPKNVVDFDNMVCHKDLYVVTPESFNTRGSRFATKTYLASNKYTSGSVQYHRIKSGDSLSTIARKYGTSITRLCQLNNITKTTTIRAGKSLRIS